MAAKNYKLNIQYDGTDFYGWQVQAVDRTVQGDIEKALGEIVPNQKITLIGSGRTDSGVHALNQIANIKLDTKMSADELTKALNSKLGRDVWISQCQEVNDDFHARFSAGKRDYRYNISFDYSPFSRNNSWWVRYSLDEDLLHKCASMVKGEKDFTTFCKATAEVNNKICTIFKSNWKWCGEFLEYKISANRFLQHMVRFLVGTMVEVARGRISIEDFKLLLDNSHKSLMVFRAPAQGLFLVNVHYQDD